VPIKFEAKKDQWTPACYVVSMVWHGVDAPTRTGGIATTNIGVANRLRRAWLAGAALDLTRAQVATDVSGLTYVQVNWTVRARCLNADLRKLGY
jgi:hypothetical protein